MSGKDQSTAMASFNPRPARGPGATSPLTPPPVLLRQPVSILARPSGRALPPYGSAWLPEDAFQSSPGPWAGRYPRPRVVVASGDRVSILARPSGRALPHRTPASCLRPWALRVSILARPSGRALRRAWRASGCRGRCFNPRPALGPGATTPSSQMRSVWSRFQSSPGPRAGRYCAAGSQGCGSARFNPRPALGPGATSPACHPSSASRSGVSILARPSGRALRAARSVVACCAARFNPRPALGPGATQSEVGRNSRQLVVSILARPSGRALRGDLRGVDRMTRNVSILARPSGRALLDTDQLVSDMVGVSILARPSGRALRVPALRADCRQAVSILARPSGRALQL